MGNIILGAIVFVVTFLGRFAIYKAGKKKDKKKKSGVATEIMYLVNRFRLDIKKTDCEHIAAIVSLVDGIIIAGALVLAISITENIFWELVVGLITVIVLIISINEIFGRILLKRGYGKK